MRLIVLFLTFLTAQGCKTHSADTPASTGTGIGVAEEDESSHFRIAAIGDIHGDLQAAIAALRLSGAIDEQQRWIGGGLRVVQTGDRVDRGDQDRAVIDLFERLRVEADKAGGEVIALNGNHEMMNASGRLTFVSQLSLAEFADLKGLDLTRPELMTLAPEVRNRAAAFLPGGPYAKILAKNGIAAVVEKTVFVHGGILPAHLDYGFERINAEAKSWLLGTTRQPASILFSADGPTWTRVYSMPDKPPDCESLNTVLRRLNAERMVVGHTIQPGISPACDGKLWRIDVGMSKYFGGKPQVLEIKDGRVSVRSK